MIFEGEIDPDEEREALIESGSLPGLRKDADVLVDRRRARISAGPADVGPQIDLARSVFRDAERPRMAVVVAADYDFGMLRMLELRGDADLPHELRVFRALAPACDFLGIAATDLGDLLGAPGEVG